MSENTTERGHLFVIDGDLTKIACDAWLLPTDDDFDITPTWQHVLRPEDLRPPSDPRSSSRQLEASACEELGSESIHRYRNTRRKDPPIYLGKIGGEGPSGIKKAIRDFLLLASPPAIERARAEHRRPLLAINAVATGQGGMKDKRFVALRTLITELYRLLGSAHTDVDVVLVCWGSVAESAAQTIRRELFAKDLASDPFWRFHTSTHRRLHREALKISALLRSGDVSVFMGAGVSAGAGLKNWDDLLVEVGRSTDPVTTREELESIHDNRDAAALLSKRLKKNNLTLESVLRRKLVSKRFSLQHGLLASMPANEYITTNVDSLFELSARQADAAPLKTIPSNDGIRSGDRWLLKIHGSVDKPGTLVFTREHYIDSFKSNRALVGLVQSMLLTRHMLFVGYGLRDEDFHELVHEVNSARGSSSARSSMGTVLALFNDRTRADLWRGTVDILPIRPASESRPTESEFQGAVRDLERFLDLVGMLSVDHSRFVLHPAYSEEQPDDIRRLKKLLGEILEEFENPAVATKGAPWQEIRRTLRSLGADIP